MSTECVLCHKMKHPADDRTWWSLRNYYGIDGRYCPGCYDKIAHDSYGRPVNLSAFRVASEELTRRKWMK